MELYARNKEHKDNNKKFFELMERYDWMLPFQPAPEKAPWHIQVRLTTRIGYDLWLNFWPHVAKGQMEGEAAVQGWDQVRLMISRAIDACQDDFPVVE